MKRLLAILALLVVGACASPDRIILAAGTTLVDGGLVSRLVDSYEATRPGATISIVGESSARILDLGTRGSADLLLTHAPDLEAAFVAAESPRLSVSVFESRFVLVGPPATIAPGLTFDEALALIRNEGLLFVSRGDGSGTHQAELEAWERVGGSPAAGSSYLETGQGMGLTLQVADQRQAFTIAEEGAFVVAADVLDIVEIETADHPVNLYTLTIPAGAPEAADPFAAWLMSDAGRAALAEINDDLYGSQIYRP